MEGKNQKLRILFIGNRHTYFNDIPQGEESLLMGNRQLCRCVGRDRRKIIEAMLGTFSLMD